MIFESTSEATVKGGIFINTTGSVNMSGGMQFALYIYDITSYISW